MQGHTTMSASTDGKPIAAALRRAHSAADVEYAAGHKNMLQLIELRWIAVIGQVTTIAAAILVFGVQLPLVQMLEVLACLIAFNVASHLRWHEHRPVNNNELFLALLVDVASLTIQLYLSGGTTNPFAFLYLLQVILSAVLLEAWSTWTIVGITLACLAGLSVFAQPLPLPFDHARGIASLYVQPRKNTSCAWACWPRVPRTNWARRWRPCP
jgi:two-component system sensor histidine kinase RegB